MRSTLHVIRVSAYQTNQKTSYFFQLIGLFWYIYIFDLPLILSSFVVCTVYLEYMFLSVWSRSSFCYLLFHYLLPYFSFFSSPAIDWIHLCFFTSPNPCSIGFSFLFNIFCLFHSFTLHSFYFFVVMNEIVLVFLLWHEYLWVFFAFCLMFADIFTCSQYIHFSTSSIHEIRTRDISLFGINLKRISMCACAVEWKIGYYLKRLLNFYYYSNYDFIMDYYFDVILEFIRLCCSCLGYSVLWMYRG